MPLFWRQTSKHIAISVVLAILFALIYYKGVSLLSLINSLFIISLIYLIFGAFMFTSRGGFFDGITYSFRTVYTRLSKKGQILKDEIDTMALPSEMFSHKLTTAFLLTGGILFFITIIVGFLI
jgi:hypothetical protein